MHGFLILRQPPRICILPCLMQNDAVSEPYADLFTDEEGDD